MSDEQTISPQAVAGPQAAGQAPAPVPAQTAAPEAPAPAELSVGTVVAGRYHVVSRIAANGAARIYEGVDLGLAERRVTLVVVAGTDRDAWASAWAAIDSPWTAPLLDVVALDGRVAAVFELDADAAELPGLAGASREQRAAVLTSVAELLERESAQLGLRICGPGQLWVEGLPLDARLRALPIPGLDAEARAEDLRVFARLVAKQLFGVARSAPPESVMAAVPDALGNELEPLLSPDSATRITAGVSGMAIRRALNVGVGASRVPVLQVVPTDLTLSSRTAAGESRARRRTRVELVVASGVFLLLVALFGSGPLVEEAPYVYDSTTTAAYPSVPPLAVDAAEQMYAMPEPTSSTFPPSDNIWPVRTAAFYTAVDLDGPVPVGTGFLGQGEVGRAAVKPWEPHVRIFNDDEGRPLRIEEFDRGNLFLGYEVYTYAEDQRLRNIVQHSSTGVAIGTVTFSSDFTTMSARNVTGRVQGFGCPSVAFELDSAGRYEQLNCRGRDGGPSVFPSGGTRWEYSYSTRRRGGEREVTRASYGADSMPITGTARRVDSYDARGRWTGNRAFDGANTPVVDPDMGAHEKRRSYAERVEIVAYYDRENLPTLGLAGWHEERTRYGLEGGLVSRSLHGVNGQLQNSSLGIAEWRYRTDANQLVSHEQWFTSDGGPVVDANGVAEIRYIRDAHNNVMSECHYGRSGVPVLSNALAGVHCRLRLYDVQGWLVGESYYGTNRLSMKDNLVEVERVSVTRDDRRRVYERSYFDAAWNPATSWSGYHGVRYGYDTWGNETSYEYLDSTGAVFDPVHGVARVTMTLDDDGRETQRCFENASGEQRALSSGFGRGAACFHKHYDEAGRLLRINYTDVDGEPVLAEFNQPRAAAEIRFNYSADGRLSSQQFRDVSGSLLTSLDCRQANQCIGTSGWSWHVP